LFFLSLFIAPLVGAIPSFATAPALILHPDRPRRKSANARRHVPRRFPDEFGHTPFSIEAKIPWKCHRLVNGTEAYGRLPVMKEVKT
jgi:hypothetical protein